MTQQQISWKLGQENVAIAKANAEANALQAQAAMKQANASESQAATAKRRQNLEDKSWGWNLGANLVSTGIGALIAWLL